MLIVFKSLKIKNFLSIGEKQIEFDFKKGINLITGVNKDNNTRNGVGKSSIIESIYWCLFGQTIRDIKNDKIIHNQQKKDCEVSICLEIHFSEEKKVNYLIKRQLGPSKIEIYEKDIDITLSTIPENDVYIQKLIGATPEVFNNAVIMTANNTLPFMAQKKIDKRKFIEGVLNLNIFTDMLLKARSDFNEAKKENDIVCNNFINLQKSLETFEQQKQNEEKTKKEKINNWNWNIENNQILIDECKNKQFPAISDLDLEVNNLETNKLTTLKQFLKKTNEKNSEVSTKKYTILAEIKQIKKEKQNILDKGNVCPTCNREYCKDEIQIVSNKLKQIENDIKLQESNLLEINTKCLEFDTKIKTIEDGIEKVNSKVKELNNLKLKIKDNDHKIAKYEHEIKQFKQFINDANKENSFADKNIEKYKEEIKKTEDSLKQIKQKMSILDDVKFILSEEGVKTYIVKKLLTHLNQKLNFYLKSLDAPCTCEFDELFEEKIINNEGKECSYFNFSGGERKRIDVAVLFTFQDVLRLYSGTSFSLSMYDELFDSAIDEAGIEKILDILKQRITDYDESIYIVSHNKTSLKSNFNDVIMLEKENGKTKIKD